MPIQLTYSRVSQNTLLRKRQSYNAALMPESCSKRISILPSLSVDARSRLFCLWSAAVHRLRGKLYLYDLNVFRILFHVVIHGMEAFVDLIENIEFLSTVLIQRKPFYLQADSGFYEAEYLNRSRRGCYKARNLLPSKLHKAVPGTKPHKAISSFERTVYDVVWAKPLINRVVFNNHIGVRMHR